MTLNTPHLEIVYILPLERMKLDASKLACTDRGEFYPEAYRQNATRSVHTKFEVS